MAVKDTRLQYYGDAVAKITTTEPLSQPVHPATGKLWWFDAQHETSVVLPMARWLRKLGGPVLVIVNDSNSAEEITILDAEGTSVGTIPVNRAAEIYCYDRTGTGLWFVNIAQIY